MRELSLSERLLALNWGVLLLVAVLGTIGFFVLYSAGGGSVQPWAVRHAARLGIGFVLMVAVALVDLRFWYRWSYAIFAAGLVLLVAVDVAGSLSKGAQRWLDLGILRLQPSETMKVALVLALARYFHERRFEEVRRLWVLLPPLALILLPSALVLLQPDLGTAVILLAIGAGMLFLAGVAWWKFALAGAGLVAALPIVWTHLHDYQKKRVLTFLDPERDPLGAGYHIIQSKIALGAGGLWGRGFLAGTQAQLDFLPEKQTDFAFTLLAEETGFVGASIVLLLYFTVMLLALLVALRASSHFGRLLAMGVGLNFGSYVFINVAMVTGLIPVVGVPLPLISYGGTAALTTMIGIGLLLCVDVNRQMRIPRHVPDF